MCCHLQLHKQCPVMIVMTEWHLQTHMPLTVIMQLQLQLSFLHHRYVQLALM